MLNVLLLDNDECIGYFGFLNGLYLNLLKFAGENYSSIHGQLPQPKSKFFFDFIELYAEFSTELFGQLFSRPGLAEFLGQIRDLKEAKVLDQVIMVTAAKRNNSENDPFNKFEKLSDWPKCVEKIVNHFAGYHVYDYGISTSTDFKSEDNKDIGAVLNLRNINIEEINQLVFVDDRPDKIYCMENCNEEQIIRYSVSAFFNIAQFTEIWLILQQKRGVLFRMLRFCNISENMLINIIHQELHYENTEVRRIYGIPPALFGQFYISKPNQTVSINNDELPDLTRYFYASS